jgi:ribonuclease HI
MGSLTLHFDGLCEPRNPGGLACYGWVIRRDGGSFAQGQGLAALNSTNNVAEYSALIAGLKAAIDLGLAGQGLEVYGDSQLVIRQMTGQYAVNADRIIPLHYSAQQLAIAVGVALWQWIPRDQNDEADQLSRIAYAEATQQAVTP